MLSGIASVPTVGNYMSVGKIVVMIVLAVPWLYLAPWVQRDCKRAFASQLTGGVVVLATGIIGMMLWLLISPYVVGMLFYIVLVGGTLLGYAIYRDRRVDPRHRVLTVTHLLSLVGGTGRRKDIPEVVTKLKLYDCHERIVHPDNPEDDPEAVRAYNLAQDVLYDIVYHRASLAELTPHEDQTHVRYVIDGVVTNRPALEPGQTETVVQFLKPAAGLDAEERRRPQEGKISVDIAGGRADMYVKTAGTTHGQLIQFRVVQESARTQLGELGMAPDVLERVRGICKATKGLILVSGQPGSGVTSTLYSLLRSQDAFIKQLISLEAQETIDLENVTQNVYGAPENLESTLVAALRRDPDVVMIDETRDASVAGVILGAAEEKLVFLGMTSSDSFVALARWTQICGAADAAVKDLLAVVHQVLIRKLCPACREQYRPDPQLLAKANLKVAPNIPFYRPPTQGLVDEKGRPIICPSCQNSRYVSRTGVFELLEMSDEVRQMIATNASLSQIRAACRKSGMLYLQEQALRKVVSGETSIQEVIRTTQQSKKK